ncbi:MAG: hypothetical protein KDK91_13155 [Gammaproteobacteria bacterium]|nr:hypothetical protein [Gammaproteobacteria bacterium]
MVHELKKQPVISALARGTGWRSRIRNPTAPAIVIAIGWRTTNEEHRGEA